MDGVTHEGVVDDDEVLNAARDAFDDDDFQEPGPSTAGRVFANPAAGADPGGRGRGNINTTAGPGARASGTGGIDERFNDVSVAAGYSSGTGGNAGDQSVMVPFAAPIYRPLSGNIHGFQKRWFFLLPVFNQSVVSTTGGQQDTTRQLLYFPGMWDFNPNLLGWYIGPQSSDESFLKQLADNGATSVRVNYAGMRAQVLAINAPFNTQATNQGTANGQLHLTGSIGSNLSRLGLTAEGCAEFTSQNAGAHNITKIRFDGQHPSATGTGTHWLQYLETASIAGTDNPLTTNGIYVMQKPDSTEGFRYYPMVLGFKCNYAPALNGTPRVVFQYPEYGKAMTHVTVGPGELFSAGGKRKNAHLGLQKSDLAPFNNQGVGLMSRSGQHAEALLTTQVNNQLIQTNTNYTLGSSTQIIDNNAVSPGIGASGPTLKPHVQFAINPPPTTTDSITTAQVCYVQVCIETEMDISIHRDHWDPDRNVAHESSAMKQWHADVVSGGGPDGTGLGNGVTDAELPYLQSYGNVISANKFRLTNIG